MRRVHLPASVLLGKDMFVCLPTGHGKSLIFECLTLLGHFEDARPAFLHFSGLLFGFTDQSIKLAI